MDKRSLIWNCFLLVFLFLFLVQSVCAQTKEILGPVIAVVDFENATGHDEYDRFKGSIAESMSTFLAKADGFSVVERKRLDAALEEIVLSDTGVVDEKNALEIGHFLQAQIIIVGSFLYENGVYRITCRGIEVETSVIRFAEQVENSDIFKAVDELSMKVLDTMGYEVREKKQSIVKHYSPWISLALSIGAASGSYLMHTKGNNAYDNYENAVNQHAMDSYFDDAESYDVKRNVMIGICGGAAILSAYLFKTRTGIDWEVKQIRLVPWMSRSQEGALTTGISLQFKGGNGR